MHSEKKNWKIIRGGRINFAGEFRWEFFIVHASLIWQIYNLQCNHMEMEFPGSFNFFSSECVGYAIETCMFFSLMNSNEYLENGVGL